MKHTMRDDDTYIHVHYDGIDDIEKEDLSLVSNRNRRLFNEAVERYDTAREPKRTRWWGFRNSTEARHAIVNGWKEGLERMRRELDLDHIPRAKSVKRRRIRSDVGDSIDMQRVYTGNLDKAWETTTRISSNVIGQHNAVIMVEGRVNMATSSEQAFWKGACAAILSDVLQQSGRSIKVVMIASNTNLFQDRWSRGKKSQVTCAIKEFENPMSTEQIAGATTAAFHRYYMFKAKACLPYNIVQGFGEEGDGSIPDYFQDMNIPIIYVPESINSKDKAMSFLKSAVSKMSNTYTH